MYRTVSHCVHCSEVCFWDQHVWLAVHVNLPSPTVSVVTAQYYVIRICRILWIESSADELLPVYHEGQCCSAHGSPGYKPAGEIMQPEGTHTGLVDWLSATFPPMVIKSLLLIFGTVTAWPLTVASNPLEITVLLMVGVGTQFTAFSCGKPLVPVPCMGEQPSPNDPGPGGIGFLKNSSSTKIRLPYRRIHPFKEHSWMVFGPLTEPCNSYNQF